ncbi:hypothetical protein HDU97_006024 [Phlyctochytrium planicorne]|nr:hypothetical protein HDU97_006024 [Phlyctochytrium planicorne]
MVPATFLSITAGIIFRPIPLAVFIVLLGSQVVFKSILKDTYQLQKTGLLMAFALGKTVLRPWIEKRVHADPNLRAIDAALSREGWKIVLLLRLSPIVPFGLCNYVLSITSMKLYSVMAATFLGNLPGATLYSFIGSLIVDLAGADHVEIDLRTKCITILFSLVFLVGSVVFITVVAKRALREATNYAPIEDNPEEDGLIPENTAEGGLLPGAAASNDASTPRERRRTVSVESDGVVEDDAEVNSRVPSGGGYTAEEQRVLYWTFAGMGISIVVGMLLIMFLT